MSEETYLGDGLYISFDGFQFKLRAPRWSMNDEVLVNHEVFLEPTTLAEFIRFISRHGWKPDPAPDLTPDDKEPL